MKLTFIALMIIQLCKQFLSSFDEYILYTDNFFTSTKLFKTLRTFNINACNIAKSNSEYLFNLFAVRDVITKKNNWNLKTHTMIDKMLCMIQIDLNTMQLIITAYDIFDIKIFYFLSFKRRHEISEKSVEFFVFFICHLSQHIHVLYFLKKIFLFFIQSNVTINICYEHGNS